MPPCQLKDVQAFLGFANFYRRFIHGYSETTAPLTRLTQKTTTWNWTEDCQQAFNKLKQVFVTAPVLTHWDPESPFIIETNASNYTVAAILSTQARGDIHPIAFHSQMLSPAELNYDVHNKELLAIFDAFKKWRYYLEGTPSPVVVFTDHKNLEWFCESKVLSRRQARWSEFLSQFNISIKFRPGRLGTKPDSLTCCWDVYCQDGLADFATANPQNWKPVFAPNQLAIDSDTTRSPSLLSKAATVLDKKSLLTDIKRAIASDPSLKEFIESSQQTTSSLWTLDQEGTLYFGKKIFVPDIGDLRLRVLRSKHNHILAGHLGREKTLQLVLWDYNWPKVREFVVNYVRTCNTCMRNKPKHHKSYGLLKQLPIPPQPWESISIDFIEQLPSSEGYTDILVVVDRLTKQVVFTPTVRTIDAKELANLFIRDVFAKHGAPAHITSDHGSEFVSKFFKSLATALDVRLHFTSGYHPEANGQTERTNQTLEQYFQTYCNYQQSDWA